MNITWYGHRCVRLESKEGSVLIDPYDPKAVGLRGPAAKDDIVLMSAYEQSKGVLERFTDGALLVRGPGEYEKKGIAVRGVQAAQDSQEGRELGLSTVFAVTAEELVVAHLGALGQEKLTDAQMEAIGEPDILILAVDGQGAMDAKAAAALVTAIEPKIVIPIGTEKPDRFVKELGLPVEKVESLRIQKKQLPTDRTMLVVLSA